MLIVFRKWSAISIEGDYFINQFYSSVKWSDPGHFLKSQGKFFFCHFHVKLTIKLKKH